MFVVVDDDDDDDDDEAHLLNQVACNMSPLGRRRGPALRAQSGGGPCGCPLCQTTAEGKAYFLRFFLLRSLRRPRAFRRPLTDQMQPGPFSALFGATSATFPPSCVLLRIFSAMLPRSCLKMPPQWPQVGEDTIWGPSWGPPVGQKPAFSRFFCLFLPTPLLRLKMPKMAPRWPQDGPRWPKIAPRWPQDGQRWPKMAQDGPRWPQDPPKRPRRP